MTRSLKRQPLTDRVSEAITDLIAERGLRAGDALPSAGDLAAIFDVSIPVVREALAGLASVGVLQKHQGRETLISAPDASHLGRVLESRVSSLAIGDRTVQEYREIVEVGNARLAALHRTVNHLTRMESALDFLRAVTSEQELHRADVEFHSLVAVAGGNDLMTVTLDAIQPLLRRLREHAWHGWVSAGGDFESIVQAHETILERIRQGDELGAAEAMSSHLRQARQGLEAHHAFGSRPFGGSEF